VVDSCRTGRVSVNEGAGTAAAAAARREQVGILGGIFFLFLFGCRSVEEGVGEKLSVAHWRIALVGCSPACRGRDRVGCGVDEPELELSFKISDWGVKSRAFVCGFATPTFFCVGTRRGTRDPLGLVKSAIDS